MLHGEPEAAWLGPTFLICLMGPLIPIMHYAVGLPIIHRYRQCVIVTKGPVVKDTNHFSILDHPFVINRPADSSKMSVLKLINHGRVILNFHKNQHSFEF